MKICVALRGNSPANLKEGNLRSEARWERQALEACLQNPQVSDVYTIGSHWQGSHPKYRGGINGNKSSSTILLVQDWNNSIINSHRFKAALVNIFSGPWVEQINEVKSSYNKINKNLFFTMGFPIMYRNEFAASSRWGSDQGNAESASHLLKFLPYENILLLPVPAAPYIIEGVSSFDKTNLLWASRLIFMSQMGESKSLLWSLQKLKQCPELTLDILTGWYKSEVKDYINEQVIYRPDIVTAFWELPAFSSLVEVRNRVNIHLDLNWDDVLRKYSNSKLLTTYGRLFGGPPVEAGMHGVPFIGSSKTTGALGDCSEYLHSNNEEEACIILEKLFYDQDYYIMVGNSYRNYVRDNYTYEAFNRNLNNILAAKGLL